jgi:hypothetical protein
MSKRCTQLLFIRLFIKTLHEKYNGQSEAAILATPAIPTRLMKGVTMDMANCPDLAPTHIIVNLKASPKSSNSEPGAPTGPANPHHAPSHALRSRCLHLPRTHLQKRDPCIKLARPAIDTTTAPDSATSLHESITPRPSPRPRCAMPSSLAEVNALDAHYSTTRLHQPADAPKTMPSKGRATLTCGHRLI